MLLLHGRWLLQGTLFGRMAIAPHTPDPERRSNSMRADEQHANTHSCCSTGGYKPQERSECVGSCCECACVAGVA